MKEYFPLILYIVICVGNVVAIAVIARVMGPKRKSKNKFTVYECGLDPTVDARHKVNIKFYLTAVIFLLFDIELIFLLPWAGTYTMHVHDFPAMGLFRLCEVGLFMGLLVLGLIFVYRRKALEWD
jgi:NADH-quinone oxidoreductase subunit A